VNSSTITAAQVLSLLLGVDGAGSGLDADKLDGYHAVEAAGNSTIPIRSAAGDIASTTFTGALTGNVTGNLTGDVVGDITGNLTGDVTGDINSTTINGYATSVEVKNGVETSKVLNPDVHRDGHNPTGAGSLTTANKSATTGWNTDEDFGLAAFDGTHKLVFAKVKPSVACSFVFRRAADTENMNSAAATIMGAGATGATVDAGEIAYVLIPLNSTALADVWVSTNVTLTIDIYNVLASL
jgi:hypothetical protein